MDHAETNEMLWSDRLVIGMILLKDSPSNEMGTEKRSVSFDTIK